MTTARREAQGAPRCPFCGKRMSLISFCERPRWLVDHNCGDPASSFRFEYIGPLRKTKAGAISAARKDLSKRFRRWMDREC